MATDNTNATTGAPEFLNSGAQDGAVDLTTVAAYAAEVGNRIVKANLAALDAYPYARAGLTGHALDTKTDYVHDGSGWRLWHRAPESYTPTLTNVSGSPDVTARYSIAAGWVNVSVVIVLNGANFGSVPGISLPVSARTPSGFQMLGNALFRKASAWYEGGILLATATRVDPVLKLVSGSNINMSTNVNATSPFTWAADDVMTLQFSYEAL